jgi:D-3-phosphoglycerate dehydrogenase
VAGADYISINIPYIKGTPEEGGTHGMSCVRVLVCFISPILNQTRSCEGIVGKEVISHFKPDAVLLNFARGELVDSDAMKEFLDLDDGRYISDFPDDKLWDHKNALILPHLGASTEEAEDSAVSCLSLVIDTYSIVKF